MKIKKYNELLKEKKDNSTKIKTKNQTFKVEIKGDDIHIFNTYGGGFIYVKSIDDLNELCENIKKLIK